MVAQQRYAAFSAAIAAAALSLFLGLIPLMGATRAQAAFALLGLLGFGPLLFRRRGAAGATDERDQGILLWAGTVGNAIFLCLFNALIALGYAYYARRGTVPVSFLPLVMWLGWTMFTLCQALAQLALYGRS